MAAPPLVVLSAVLGALQGVQTPVCRITPAAEASGFERVMYLFSGAPDYSLTYNVPEASVTTAGAQVGVRPIKLLFSGLRADGVDRPDINLQNLDLQELDGTPLQFGGARLVCGDDAPLTFRFSHGAQPAPKGPMNFWGPFFEHRSEMPKCFDSVRRTGRLTLGFSRMATGADVLTLDVRLPLGREMASVSRDWRRVSTDAARGRCRFNPPPPPPF